MMDVEELFRKADFTAGSNYKDELRNKLFAAKTAQTAKPVKKTANVYHPVFGRGLSDDELGMAAGGMVEPEIPQNDKIDEI